MTGGAGETGPRDLDLAGGSLRVLLRKGDKACAAPLPSNAAEAVDHWLDCRKRLGLTGRLALFSTLKVGVEPTTS